MRVWTVYLLYFRVSSRREKRDNWRRVTATKIIISQAVKLARPVYTIQL